MKKFKNLIILVVVIILLLSLSNLTKVNFPAEYEALAQYTPSYNITEYPLPFILYSNATPKLILASRKSFKAYNLSGFILTALPSNWNSNTKELGKYFWQCRRLTWFFPQSFLRISLTEKNMPSWENKEEWVSVNAKLKNIVRFARFAGFAGILLDTKAYDPAAWNPSYFTPYKNISEDLARKIIYQEGRTIMTIINDTFPKAKILITPAGLLAQPRENQEFHPYYYWIHFFNGLLSIDHPGLVVLIPEESYFFSQKTEFTNFQKYTREQLQAQLDYPETWFKNQALALMAWPLGTTDQDKQPFMDAQTFKTQLFWLQKYSQKYVFIFSKGQAWWQTEQGAELGFDPEQTEQAKIVQTRKFVEYTDALRSFKNTLLTCYFEKIQQNKNISYLDFYLKYLSGILKP